MGDDPDGSYGLRGVLLEDKPLFDSYFAATPSRLSDYSFAGTFIWRHPIHLRWAVLHGHLCVFANGENGLTMIAPPMGDGDFEAAVRASIEICRDFNHQTGHQGNMAVEYVTGPIRDRFPAGFTVEPMGGDYVYSTEKMITLAGGELSGKRHDRKRFMTRYAPRTEPFGPQHVQPCLDLLAKWQCQHADSEDNLGETIRIKRAKESFATGEAIRHWDAIGLKGMVLYVGDEMVGFTFGELLGADTCNILIEKTDRTFAGSAQYIFSEFCRQAWSATTWCNAGDDWEIPSLAYTKQSYRPAFRIEKWRMVPVPATVVAAPSSPRHEPAAETATVAVEMPTVAIDAFAVIETPADVAVVVDAGALMSTEPTATSGFGSVTEEAREADLDDLVALENRSFDAELAISRRQWKYLMRSRTADVRVVHREGRVVASLVLLRFRVHKGVLSRIYSLAVDAECRHQGLGRAMVREAMEQLRHDGVRTAVLEVELTNVAAIRLYETLGFSTMRRLVDYYGPGRDGWKMRIDLVQAKLLAM
ncbi:MAG: GNAT family N-acetyltransferase [Planctomycetes bacterium]|nr:GNAT family N-acetyltransferase [Planctomycetota bacterium]